MAAVRVQTSVWPWMPRTRSSHLAYGCHPICEKDSSGCFRKIFPLDHAFDELSVLLGCIRHLSEEAEMESNLIAGSATRILSAMAKALINDMEMGLNSST
jgi:Protein of unknown function (DUF3077).